ncbi:hypothetical protein [Paenibacillus sacheonensis]|uniref:Lipoprotein n=1 Tax=Paenibacillus sacheonensis TaxID=742054 RepID=A0A7X4YK53_9BACL|nr:hypothetical protein [Paenibacillus sacheonensis]MBM7563869.1 hypothetical protein [Paenibacillus sacheonensis]NBC67783.1 hypothetical protein [Paenibacillus sacheonensis]
MRKKFIVVIGLFALSLSACGAAEEKNADRTVGDDHPQTKVSGSASWAYAFVVWNHGQTYAISDEAVPEAEIGRQIGEVRRNVSNMDSIAVPEGEAIQPYEKQDGDSSLLKEGSKLFELTGTAVDSAIVVMNGGNYVKAARAE